MAGVRQPTGVRSCRRLSAATDRPSLEGRTRMSLRSSGLRATRFSRRSVTRGLDPRVHLLRKTFSEVGWIAGSSPAMTGESSDLLTSRRQDDGLAGRLRVEEPVGFLGLLEPPAVREEPLHVHLPLGDELGALGPALLRERPRPHQRDLPAQEIRADVERDLTPLADVTGGAPRAYGPHGRGTGVRRRGGVERLVRALAVRQLGNRRDHVVRRGIDHLGYAELPGKLASLGCDVDGDDARAHLDGEQVARMSEAKSGISRLNARPAMAGVRHSPGGDT